MEQYFTYQQMQNILAFLILVTFTFSIVSLIAVARHHVFIKGLKSRYMYLKKLINKELSSETYKRVCADQNQLKLIEEQVLTWSQLADKVVDIEDKMTMNFITLDARVNNMALDNPKSSASFTKKKAPASKKKVAKKTTKKAAKKVTKKTTKKKVTRK